MRYAAADALRVPVVVVKLMASPPAEDCTELPVETTDAKTYRAEYHGSGTFIIHKPKRNRRKLRQSRLKNPQRGARK